MHCVALASIEQIVNFTGRSIRPKSYNPPIVYMSNKGRGLVKLLVRTASTHPSSSAHGSKRTFMAIVGLALTAFVFNTSEFVPVGLLTSIATSFSLTEAQAGLMISVYAWGVTILSLPLMIFASRFNMRDLMLAVIALFAIGQLTSALAPTFVLLVCARLLVAAAHAIFWSIAPSVATRVASPKHASMALSMIATGTSLAMILGMPLGRVVGLMLGWRATFALMGIAAVVALVYLAVLLPSIAPGKPFTLRELPQLLHNPALVSLYLVTIFMACGYYTAYSYIEPFMEQVVGFSATMVTAVLITFGAAGIVGSYLFSRFYDGHRSGFIRAVLLGLAVALCLLYPLAGVPGAPFVLCALWGLSATAFNVAFQAEVIHNATSDTSTVATAIFSGLFNLGVGCGSALGGVVVNIAGIAMVGFVGGIIALVGVAVAVFGLTRVLY